MECIRLKPEEAHKFREIRLEGLKAHPEYSTASYEREIELPLSFFTEKLENEYFYGFYEGGEFVGIGGLYCPFTEEKKQHIVRITGVYLRDEYRGQGLAKTLMEQLLEKASKIAKQAILNVGSENEVAISLYESYGFKKIGVVPNSLKIGDDEYVDEMMMVKIFD